MISSSTRNQEILEDTLSDNTPGTPQEESEKRFSFIESVTPILLREKKNEGNDKSKWRSSLENPVFRQPLEKWQPFESHVDRDTNKEVNNNGLRNLPQIDSLQRNSYYNGSTSRKPVQSDVYRRNMNSTFNQSDSLQQQQSSVIFPRTDGYPSTRMANVKRHSNRSYDIELSCDSDGGVSEELSPHYGTNSNTLGSNSNSSFRLKQTDSIGTLNVREMASFLEKTDSFIRMLEPAADKSHMHEVSAAPYPNKQLNERRSWNSDYSFEQISSYTRGLAANNENDSSLQRMEQSINLQKENARLKERILILQGKLEQSEKENVQLRDLITSYQLQFPQLKEQPSCNNMLNPEMFEYSRTGLTKIMQNIGIPELVIERITIQVELEFQRRSKQNYLLTALSYTFDFMMRSFVEENYEYPLAISSYSEKSETPFYPCYSSEFKDFIDLLSQDQYQVFYDEIKGFVIEKWINIYNQIFQVNEKSLAEILRDFCKAMETKIMAAFDRDIDCELEAGDVKEGMEQLIMNLVGGGLINALVSSNAKKESILNKHICILQFLQPEHLEVKAKYVEHPKFTAALSYLRSIVFCRSPKHMLWCLSETTKTLFSILGSEHSSADDFLPLFIYCTIKTKTLFLQSISDYINQYRNPKDLVMGDGYMLVNLISSLQFISTIDANCLSINAIDYQMAYSAAEDALRDQGNKRFSIF